MATILNLQTIQSAVAEFTGRCSALSITLCCPIEDPM
jgi:hypothetical protein